MSVLKKDRKESKLQVWDTAQKLKLSLTYALMKDFGTKAKVKDVDWITQGMSDMDKEIVNVIAERNNMKGFAEHYPAWLIEFVRNNILFHIESMCNNITHAKTIWATNEDERSYRRLCQSKAIGDCAALLNEFTYALDLFQYNTGKYMHIVEQLEYEMALLKAWRKSDNKRYKNTEWSKDEATTEQHQEMAHTV